MPVMLATEAAPPPPVAPRLPRTVMPFIDHGGGHSTHELASLHAASRRLPALLGCAGDDAGASGAGARYWLPMRTLLREEAERLGIGEEGGPWRGVGPHAFVGTRPGGHPTCPRGTGRAGGRSAV